MHTDSCLLFQKWSKLVQENWPKGRIVCLMKETKHILAPLGGTLGAISRKFCVSAHRSPSFIFTFHLDLFRFRGVTTGKPLSDPQSECNIGSLSL